MTREQLLALGFTEEQVNQIMALHGQATQSLRGQITTLTADLALAQNKNAGSAGSQNAQGESGDDSALQTALDRIKELEKENRRKDISAYAASKNLSGEQAEKILNAFGDDVDAAKGAIDSIGQIISTREAAAATAKEQEIASKATNPGGGSGGSDEKEKSNAEKLATKFFGEKKSENSVISHYVTGGNTNV